MKAESAKGLKDNSFSELLNSIMLRYAIASRESYLKAWEHWELHLKKSALKASVIDANIYIDKFARTALSGRTNRKGELPAKATIKKRIMILHSLYQQVIAELNLNIRNPFEPLFQNYKRVFTKQVRPTHAVAKEKVLELINAPMKSQSATALRDAAFFALLFGAGLRIGEAQKLNLENILETGSVYTLQLIDTKNGDDIEQPLPKWASEILKKYLKTIENGPLLVDFNKYGSSTGRRAARSTLYKRFKFWAAKVGLHNVSPHSARATAITQLLDQGLNHRDVREFSRHKSISMVETYDKRRLQHANHPALKLSYSNYYIKNNKNK